MKTLVSYINEKQESSYRKNIKFTIWNDSGKICEWIDDNNSYQKIEYKFLENDLSICFLLGFKNNSWHLWIGKIGAITYNDDPYCSLECSKFSEAISKSLDKIDEIINMIKSDKSNWIQFYNNI